MIIEIKIPSPGESITEVEIGRWLVENGDQVTKDQEIAEVESDKATLALIATESGAIQILAQEGQTIGVGDTACTIDTEQAGKETSSVKMETPPPTAEAPQKEEAKPETPTEPTEKKTTGSVKVTPAARAVMKEQNVDIEAVLAGLKRLNRSDIERAIAANSQPSPAEKRQGTREETREKLTPLRKKLSQRLVSVKNETAMLTTFNEVDMSAVMAIRKKYQSLFIEKHGLKIGFMSFFTKAVSEALKQHPGVNAMLDEDEMITPHYHDVGIAVQTPKGLMVPIVRNVETKSLATIEKEIKTLAEKARNRRLSIEEMIGGTFTITNGGVFGSLLSTPIINPPQSGILGMHTIKERPVAINGKVEIRPMMYLALSYDHRIIDGKDSVGFLLKVKTFLENPEMLLFQGKSTDEMLLDL